MDTRNLSATVQVVSTGCHSRPNPEIEALSTRTLAGRASWLGQTKTGESVREARTTPPTLNMWMYWCLVAFPRYGKTVFPTAHIALISCNYVPGSELYDILGNVGPMIVAQHLLGT